ncbi:hypothetical protein Q9L58_008567 [Maublancomyces gigas]|uniref:Uncharacterized protein n=1 Tax=Discina gigas TaxID=1032678 RepID=A0ABR3GAF5_9PEZI
MSLLTPHPPPVARRRRTAFSSTRIIPTLRRHETMLFGDALNPVPCQSQENHDESSEEEEEERGGTQSSAGTSQESVAVAPKES